jgi:hypothetical protein
MMKKGGVGKEEGKGQEGGGHDPFPATNCLMKVNKTMIPGVLLFNQSQFEAQMS